MLPALTKLQLGNNIIRKIENLDSLVNLKQLDLSFNNIKVIENLDVSNCVNFQLQTLLIIVDLFLSMVIGKKLNLNYGVVLDWPCC